jgi:hypothetical protein
MDLKQILESKLFKGILVGVGVAIAVILIFEAGIAVGYHKAAFSYHFGDNYYRIFDDQGMIPIFSMREMGFPDAHGALGKIIKIDLPTLVIEEGGTEKAILVGDDTVIRKFRETIKATELKVNDSVIVIGSPNDKGEVEAKLIRLVPQTSGSTTGTTTVTK